MNADPDFKYLSKSIAGGFVSNAAYNFSFHGLNFAVCVSLGRL